MTIKNLGIIIAVLTVMLSSGLTAVAEVPADMMLAKLGAGVEIFAALHQCLWVGVHGPDILQGGPRKPQKHVVHRKTDLCHDHIVMADQKIIVRADRPRGGILNGDDSIIRLRELPSVVP